MNPQWGWLWTMTVASCSHTGADMNSAGHLGSAKTSPDFSEYENSVREGERERQCVFVGAVVHACIVK